MAKFCKNCGNQMEDETVFCGNCGARVDAVEQAQQENNNNVNVNAPEEQNTSCDCGCEANSNGEAPKGASNFINDFINKLKNKDKNAIIIVAGIAAVLVLCVVLVFALSSGGAAGAVEDYYALELDGDADVIEDLAPESVIKDFEKKYNVDVDDVIEVTEKAYEDKLEKYEREDEDYSFEYDIIDEFDLTEDELDSLKDILKERYDISRSDVTDGKKICMRAVAETKDGDTASYSTEYAVKIDGDWYPVESGKFVIETYFANAMSKAPDVDDYMDDVKDYIDDYMGDYGY